MLARNHKFDPADPSAVRYWDTVENAELVDSMFTSMTAFLGAIAVVTLTLGANDVFRFQKDCAVGPTVGTCPLGLGGVAAVMLTNLNTIFSKIRSTGYHGLIVAVTYYALDYRDTSGSLFLNGPMIAAATAHGAVIASGLVAWQATALAVPAPNSGDSCVAGLLIRTSATGCDVHPTPKGRDLLAGAVIAAIAASCPAHNAEDCLDRGRD